MLPLSYKQRIAKQSLSCIHCPKTSEPRCSSGPGIFVFQLEGWSALRCSMPSRYFLVLLLTNQGKHTMEEVNESELYQSLCPSLSILNRIRSEMGSQTLHFPLGWTLLLAHWGCIFGSVQFICELPNLVCGFPIPVGAASGILLIFSLMVLGAIPSSEVDAASSLSFSRTELWHPNSPSQNLDFCFCCSCWQHAFPLRALLPLLWEWCFMQSPDQSGVPSVQDSFVPNKEKLRCMWTEAGEMPLQLCAPFLENSSGWGKWE